MEQNDEKIPEMEQTEETETVRQDAIVSLDGACAGAEGGKFV